MVDIAREPLAKVLDEVWPLVMVQWNSDDTLETEPNFNIERYLALNVSNHYLQYTIRDNDVLVGHCGMMVFPALRDRLLYASDEFIYIVPEYRGKCFDRLLKYMENDLTEMGVKELAFRPHIKSKFGRLLGFKGYEPVATIHRKKLA